MYPSDVEGHGDEGDGEHENQQPDNHEKSPQQDDAGGHRASLRLYGRIGFRLPGKELAGIAQEIAIGQLLIREECGDLQHDSGHEAVPFGAMDDLEAVLNKASDFMQCHVEDIGITRTSQMTRVPGQTFGIRRYRHEFGRHGKDSLECPKFCWPRSVLIILPSADRINMNANQGR